MVTRALGAHVNNTVSWTHVLCEPAVVVGSHMAIDIVNDINDVSIESTISCVLVASIQMSDTSNGSRGTF